MGDAKNIEVRAIPSATARAFVERVHYSGSTVQNSQIHLGVFMAGRLHGVMQFGPPLDRRKILPIIEGAGWESVIELNRMAFDEALPRNSESRALAVAFRMFKRFAPQVTWIVSFADGCQCGDGTIYRASGFLLTGIKRNGEMWLFPDGRIVASSSMRPGIGSIKHANATRGGSSMSAFKAAGAYPLPGHQFRYIRLLDPALRDRLTVPVIPFDQIPDHARMYRGTRRPVEGPGHHPDAGGADPTPALHTP